MESPVASIRYALRQFRSSPVFTAAAVLTLALGIGGTTAIFTLIHAVMLRSLPVADPASLYRIGDGDDCCVAGRPTGPLGAVLVPAVRTAQGRRAGVRGGRRLPGRRRAPQRAARGRRRGRAAAALRVRHRQLLLARSASARSAAACFAADDDTPSAPPVAVLSHHVWQTAYGGDASVVGGTFVVEGHPFTVDRHRAARILRRNAARRSARPVDSAAAGAADRRRQRRCCASRCPRGCA